MLGCSAPGPVCCCVSMAAPSSHSELTYSSHSQVSTHYYAAVCNVEPLPAGNAMFGSLKHVSTSLRSCAGLMQWSRASHGNGAQG